MRKLISIALLLFTPALAFANNPSCYHDVGDGPDPKVLQHAVLFRGPNNGFWDYLSEDPSTWIFEIVSTKNLKVKKPTFERIAFKRPDGEYVNFEKHIKVLANNRFTFETAKIASFVEESTKALREMRKANPNAFPLAEKQLLDVVITFKAASPDSDEDWLNHSCSLGFGRNSLSGRLNHGGGKALSNFSFVIDVNNPMTDSTWLKDKIAVKTDAKGAFLIKGLPLGTFIADLPTPNKMTAIAYFPDLPKNCEWEIKKESQTETGWTVTKNNCASLSPAR